VLWNAAQKPDGLHPHIDMMMGAARPHCRAAVRCTLVIPLLLRADAGDLDPKQTGAFATIPGLT